MSEKPLEPRLEEPEGPQAPSMAPAQIAYLRSRLISEQNLAAGVLGGAAASLLGSILWATLTLTTGYQIGFMAVGIGILVGLAVRWLGKGVDTIFGVIGGGLSFLGCAIGNLFAVTALAAAHEGANFFEVLAALTPGVAYQLMAAFFNPLDLLFYGIAVYEGYKLAFRHLTQEDLARMLRGTAAPEA